MTSALRKGMTYRKGLINGASQEYFDREKVKERMKEELRSLVVMAAVGISLVLISFVLLRAA